MAESSRVRLRITGQVQGVSFRYYARQRAHLLGLSGWVRNCPDGAVEAAVEGEPEAVRRFVAWAREGPPMAEVAGIEVRDEPAEGEGSFRIVG